MAGPWDATRGFQPAHERADVPWFASEEFERDARESEPVASEDVEPKPPREPPAAPPPMPRAGFPGRGNLLSPSPGVVAHTQFAARGVRGEGDPGSAGGVTARAHAVTTCVVRHPVPGPTCSPVKFA